MRIYAKVIPRSSKNEVIKMSENDYKVRVTAPPVGGKANEMLVKLLAEYFDVAKSRVLIVAGKTARVKMIDIAA